MRILRKILFPFSIIYDLVTSIRNFFFDKGVFKSKSYKLPIIAVGNLSVGGTGKSPMIEYLIRLLKDDYKLATLSRGYGRKSVGFVLANKKSTAKDLGDEPMQFHEKFKAIDVAVDGNRQNGIAQIQQMVKPEVILLDDAFQHRKVTAGFYVLLTKFEDLYVNDFLLPAGNLRESKRGAKRADVIVVTKCPENLSFEAQEKIIKQLKPSKTQKVYFTSISYSDAIFGNTNNLLLKDLLGKRFTLVTGIANPKPLVTYLKKQQLLFDHIIYKDHHNFSANELKVLAEKEMIITTEKDYMRLKGQLNNVYYLPIETVFLNKEKKFNNIILDFVRK